MSNLNNLAPFYVGQKVVCISGGTWYLEGQSIEGPKTNETCEVKGFCIDDGVLLVGYNTGIEDGYEPEYFRPLQEQKFPLISMTKVLEEVEVCSN